MRRSILLTTSALGLLICLLGSTGLFAALTDTADTGTNEITTDALAGSADLQLATWTGMNCGTYVDDLTTGLFTVTSAAVGSTHTATVCVRNVGARTVDLDIGVIGLQDVDVACTGDEAESGDTTCGNDGQGELAGIVSLQIQPTDCAGQTTGPLFGGTLQSLQVPLALLPSLATNAVTCYELEAFVGTGATAVQQQLAQSDSATWQFRFTGTAQ